MFLNFLDYKRSANAQIVVLRRLESLALAKKGGVLVEIGRFFPSSKLCSHCGHKYQELTLSERVWTCDSCSTTHIRDEVAATNIRTEGMRILGLGHSPRGDNVRLEACLEQSSVKRIPSYKQLTLF